MGLMDFIEKEKRQAKVDQGDQEELDRWERSPLRVALLEYMDENSGDEVDVTATIEVYEKGKTWDCPCGMGIGTGKSTMRVRCASCGRQLKDSKGLER